MTQSDDLRAALDLVDDEISLESVETKVIAPEKRAPQKPQYFLGLTPAQRALLSFILFLNVLILGFGLLVITGRIVF
jgi:hypothetical protein